MTQDEAKTTAEQQNRFDPEAGCPFKSACIKGKCPAFIPAVLLEDTKNGESTGLFFVVVSGCKIIRGLEKLAEM
jgi:hypothetical protein